jgi:hypothetical protein
MQTISTQMGTLTIRLGPHSRGRPLLSYGWSRFWAFSVNVAWSVMLRGAQS